MALLDRLGHPERHFPSVHIGGTNGKGSVATLVAEALRAAGHRTGLYTSPHLVSVRERMMVDGTAMSDDAFVTWTRALEDTIVESGASFFEATTAIAFADFAARHVDLAVIEVGLGGRLDATNVLNPLASAVTQISREHTDYLGESLTQIAEEKAGIAKPGRPFVIGERDPDLAQVLEQAARRTGALTVRVDPQRVYGGCLALHGAHQRRNAAVAEAVLAALPATYCPPGDAITSGFARAWLPGRCDRRGRWLFDVAHNPAGLETLIATMEEINPPRPISALVGILSDKDWHPMLQAMLSRVDRVYVTVPPSAPADRVWSLHEVSQAVPSVVPVPDFDRALALAQTDAATVIVTGSFHTVGDAMSRLPGFAPVQ
ncbi:MAG: Mur ligase family protein [Gemmatimonadota bacterium]|nr:Mur ligase family protein [Gemmatimonadota bacterium]